MARFTEDFHPTNLPELPKVSPQRTSKLHQYGKRRLKLSLIFVL